MPRGGSRRRFRIGYNKGPIIEWEWIGFRSAGAYGNLNVAVVHELIPPIADNTVGIQAFTVHRIVGTIHLLHQNSIVSNDTAGIMIGVEDAGADQTFDNPLLPITTDIDHLAHKGIMWSWIGQLTAGVAAADSDVVPLELPIDLTVKRIVSKRQRLVISIEAATTGRLRAICNVRALIRESAGS